MKHCNLGKAQEQKRKLRLDIIKRLRELTVPQEDIDFIYEKLLKLS